MEKNKGYDNKNPWAQYVATYKKNHPEKAELWKVRGYCTTIRKYLANHPEQAEDVRKRVFGE